MSPHEAAEGLTSASASLPTLVSEMECKLPYAAASLSRNSGLLIAVRDHEQSMTEIPPSQGLVLSAWNGAYFEECASDDLRQESMLAQARRFAVEISPQPGDPAIDPGAALQGQYTTPCQQDPSALSPRDKLDLCQGIYNRTRGLDPRIVNVQVRYSETLESKVFANRARFLTQQVQRMRINVNVFVSDGKQVQYDWIGKDGTGGLEIVAISDDELHKLVESAIAMLSAQRVPPGMYDVVCTPDVSGVIAHEAFGHGVELDMFLKGRARAAQYLGKPVASALVNILDDPSYPGGHGTYFFDDEGQLATPTCIIRQGTFERGLADLFSAHKLGVARSANGRRESFERKVYVRMSNTFFASGSTPLQQMIESVDKGVYLQHTSSGMEDPKGWGMQVTCQYGEEILHGRLTGRRFAPIGITGYVPDILQSVSMVGNDLALTGGTCGKGHKEWVPVSSGGPHLKLKARLG